MESSILFVKLRKLDCNEFVIKLEDLVKSSPITPETRCNCVAKDDKSTHEHCTICNKTLRSYSD